MNRLVTVNLRINDKLKLIPIALPDDWVISQSHIDGKNLFLLNAMNGDIVTIDLSSLIDNNHMDWSKKMSEVLINGISQMVNDDYSSVSPKKTTNRYSNSSRVTNTHIENLFYLPRSYLRL
jgi:hypothetical protein